MVATQASAAYSSAAVVRHRRRWTWMPLPPNTFRTDIGGLRAVAIGLVVAYHAGINVVRGGFVGIDVSFVISGFLITAQLSRELVDSGRISLPRFYSRRIVRLLPALVVVVVATLAATWHWASPLLTDRQPSPLLHLWSLAVEGQFYLCWPLLLLVASLAWRRARPNMAIAAIGLATAGVASLALCLWQTNRGPAGVSLGIQTRAWELAAGALVALAAGRLTRLPAGLAGTLSWSGLAAILASAVVNGDEGAAAIVPVLGATLVIAGGCAAPLWGADTVLRLQPLQELGRLSYSWYLWHWPVLVIAPYVLGYSPGLWLRIALTLSTLLPAAMSLAILEDRIRFHPVFRFRARNGLILGAVLSTVVGLTAFAAVFLPEAVIGRATPTDTATWAATPQRLLDLVMASSLTTTMPTNLVPPLDSASIAIPARADVWPVLTRCPWLPRRGPAVSCTVMRTPLPRPSCLETRMPTSGSTPLTRWPALRTGDWPCSPRAAVRPQWP
jgi:peptidoglycan/LPS O-acetylase OafA/YrhL